MYKGGPYEQPAVLRALHCEKNLAFLDIDKNFFLFQASRINFSQSNYSIVNSNLNKGVYVMKTILSRKYLLTS